MINLTHVSYCYPNQTQPILHDVSLKIETGELLLVIGSSGAGKSTLLRCLNGLVPHFYGGTFRGEVRVNGRNPLELGPRGMSDGVGFVFQDPESQFVTEQVEDELAFAMENHNIPQSTMRKRIEEVLDQLSIAHLRHRRVDTLSGGERQRVAIGSVLTLQPAILVLDEPTSQLDPQAAEEVLTTLQKLNEDLGLTIIISEHRLERVAQYADRICYLPGGNQPLIMGNPRELLAQIPLAPPLVQLGRQLNWQPLPLTIKEGRRFVAKLNFSKPLTSLNDEILPRISRINTNTHLGTSGLKISKTTAPPTITVHEVWHHYNGKESLKGITFNIQSGEFVALMGRNGSGKSTLLKSMVGLLKPQRGYIKMLGQNSHQTDLLELTRQVGFVPQNPGRLLFNETLAEEIAFTRRAHQLPEKEVEAWLSPLGLDGLAEAYPRDLSVGERQRAALVAILAAEPKILLLDEPTRGLDYLSKEKLTLILRELCQQGMTVVMATHDVELVARCAHRVIILGEGQVVVDGPTRQVMTESLLFASQINKLLRDSRFLTVEDVLKESADYTD